MSKKNSSTVHLVLAGMLMAVGVVMPRLFHFAGPQAGSMFLPLFWAVGLAGLILPVKWAILVGVLLPCISNLISAMPAVPMLYFMIIELAIYATMAYVFHKKMKSYLAIAAALAVSRICYIGCVYFAAELLGLPAPYAGAAALVGSIAKSIPGIGLQIVILPIIQKVYNKVTV